MKEAVFNRFGTPATVIECVETKTPPPPKDWEVKVDIMAATINPSDISVLRGQYGKLPSKFPASTGLEASGRVIEVGRTVEGFAAGDRVIMVANNNWVQQRNVPATALHRAPDWMSYEQAALFKVNAVCAQIMLRLFGDLEPGDHVIQTAPLSAVGRMVIEFAAEKGVKTVNVVRREEAIEEVRSIGGDIALLDGDSLAEKVAEAADGAPVPLALDAVAGEGVVRLADCLDTGGTLVSYGMLSGQLCQLRPDQTIFRDIRLRGFWLWKTLIEMKWEERRALFDETLAIMERRKVENAVSATFPLERVAEALEASEQSGRAGKVLLLPNGHPG